MELGKFNKEITWHCYLYEKGLDLIAQELLAGDSCPQMQLLVTATERPMCLEETLANGEENASLLYKAVELFQNLLTDSAGGDESLAGSPSLGSS